MIAIIDYDAGNMKSVEKAFQYLDHSGCCEVRKAVSRYLSRIAAVV